MVNVGLMWESRFLIRNVTAHAYACIAGVATGRASPLVVWPFLFSTPLFSTPRPPYSRPPRRQARPLDVSASGSVGLSMTSSFRSTLAPRHVPRG
jgi:hypothetical protein